MSNENLRTAFIPLGKAKVRATFIPNGISADRKLKYSIFISLDYSTLGQDPSSADVCKFPEFITKSVFDLQNEVFLSFSHLSK